MYTLNSWLWQLKTHGHNATWRFFLRYLMVSGLNSNNSNCLLQDICDMGYNVCMNVHVVLLCDWSLLYVAFIPSRMCLTGYVNQCARIAKCNCWGFVWVTLSLTCSKSVFSDMSSKCPVKNVVFYVIMRGSF